MLRLQQADEILQDYQRYNIEVDDVDDENLLQHFPAVIKFIQNGLDAGGSVLVHWLVSSIWSRVLLKVYSVLINVVLWGNLGLLLSA